MDEVRNIRQLAERLTVTHQLLLGTNGRFSTALRHLWLAEQSALRCDQFFCYHHLSEARYLLERVRECASDSVNMARLQDSLAFAEARLRSANRAVPSSSSAA